ncbi:NUDIX hydrolase [Qipengyuania sp. DSG2-2]|uniref:NUDIX hydrolase n=1 Tax=Qipengyuania sp. DGS2-2 TaxID=3349631 RepID=UPI0036D34455
MADSAPLRLRRAARLFVLDTQGRMLMFRYDVSDRPPFWITPGGECDPGESFEDAARRELREETGIIADPGEQVLRMQPQFKTVEGEPVQGDERFYIVHVDDPQIDTSGHTELEQQVMKQHRWFTMAEMEDWHEAIYPADAAALVSGLLTEGTGA